MITFNRRICHILKGIDWTCSSLVHVSGSRTSDFFILCFICETNVVIVYFIWMSFFCLISSCILWIASDNRDDSQYILMNELELSVVILFSSLPLSFSSFILCLVPRQKNASINTENICKCIWHLKWRGNQNREKNPLLNLIEFILVEWISYGSVNHQRIYLDSETWCTIYKNVRWEWSEVSLQSISNWTISCVIKEWFWGDSDRSSAVSESKRDTMMVRMGWMCIVLPVACIPPPISSLAFPHNIIK